MEYLSLELARGNCRIGLGFSGSELLHFVSSRQITSVGFRAHFDSVIFVRRRVDLEKPSPSNRAVAVLFSDVVGKRAPSALAFLGG